MIEISGESIADKLKIVAPMEYDTYVMSSYHGDKLCIVMYTV